MMKSLDIDAQAVLLGCLKDFQAAYPKLSSLNRDGERLLSLMKNRGLSCFMIDLPNLDTILLNGLETGRLSLWGHFLLWYPSELRCRDYSRDFGCVYSIVRVT